MVRMICKSKEKMIAFTSCIYPTPSFLIISSNNKRISFQLWDPFLLTFGTSVPMVALLLLISWVERDLFLFFLSGMVKQRDFVDRPWKSTNVSTVIWKNNGRNEAIQRGEFWNVGRTFSHETVSAVASDMSGSSAAFKLELLSLWVTFYHLEAITLLIMFLMEVQRQLAW